MTAVEEIIRAEIAASGPMRFDRFMEIALYHPGAGYYAKTIPVPIGREGDFYTSVSVGPLFGRLLARQFWQMWQLLGKPTPFWIIEQGAHDGRLAVDILTWGRDEAPDFFECARYGIVEGSVFPSAAQEFSSRLTTFGRLEALRAVNLTGVFISNELVDAFPVRVIVCRDGQWRERCVEIAGDAFGWTECPLHDPELIRAIAVRQPPPIEGYTTEIHLRAEAWMTQAAYALDRGYVVTIDYGYPAHEYYAPHRYEGTLCGYMRHHAMDDVLTEPGERDITAHADFTALASAGKDAGLATLGFVDQQRFLMGIAHDELSGASGPRAGIAENTRAFQTLTHPEHLGVRFHALVQARNAPAPLDWLRFARGGLSQDL